MNYHNILKDDMRNGSGLRVTLFVSGCSHRCKKCQNPQTWDCNSGINFDITAKEEIYEQLGNDYISGITLSGGDPLHDNNLQEVKYLIEDIKYLYPNKSIWIYTGYYYNDLLCMFPDKYEVVKLCDVLVDGEYIDELSNINYHWAGSINQSVIDIKKTLIKGEIVLWED